MDSVDVLRQKTSCGHDRMVGHGQGVGCVQDIETLVRQRE